MVDEEFAGVHDKQSITADPHDARFVYAVWDREDFNAGSPALFSRTTDGGKTWEPLQILHDPGPGRRTIGNQIVVLPKMKINQTPTHVPIENQQALVPSVAVNDLGDVAITYYDFRFDGDAPKALTDFWAITCRPQKAFDCSEPAAWSAEQRLTDTSFDLLPAPDAGGLFLGDYVGLVSAGSAFVSVFPMSSATDPATLFARRFQAKQRPIDIARHKIRPRAVASFRHHERQPRWGRRGHTQFTQAK